jgi:hypothetical protein
MLRCFHYFILLLGLLLGHAVDHPTVLVQFHHVDQYHLTVGIDTLQSSGGDNVVGIIERWDNDDLIPDIVVNVNTIVTNTRNLSSSNG